MRLADARRPVTDPTNPFAAELDSAFGPLDPVERLALLRSRVPGRLVLTTSFGLEDQVLLHMVSGAGLEIDVATLDTGRLFPQTYAVWAETEKRYGLRVQAHYPEAAHLEQLVAKQGIDGFYRSREARTACCEARKLRPLGRALKGASAWITGLRSDQSANRGDMRFVTLESAHGLLKANPLLDWSRDRVAAFAAAEGVPVNALHAQGFLSIGCAPCTRPVAPGEPERAGRWWWEDDGAKECGLHVSPDGRLLRAGARA